MKCEEDDNKMGRKKKGVRHPSALNDVTPPRHATEGRLLPTTDTHTRCSNTHTFTKNQTHSGKIERPFYFFVLRNSSLSAFVNHFASFCFVFFFVYPFWEWVVQLFRIFYVNVFHTYQ